MRFGKLSYGMELLPYRYRLPGNFRRAKFLGYTFWRRKPVAHPKSIDRLKQKLKAVFLCARQRTCVYVVKVH